MNYVFYLDKSLAKKGITCALEKFIKEPENFIPKENLIKYVGNDIPHYIKYDEDKNTIVESSFIEHVNLGFRELGEGQVIINNQVEFYNPNFEYIENNEIKPKTREMLVLDGIEKPFDNEYIRDGKLKIIPKKPKDMVKGEFDFIQEQWIEKATIDEKLENLKKQIVIVNSEILRIKSAGFIDEKLEQELERLKELHAQLSHEIATKINEAF
ncbi:hypothetical protein [Cetobacterium sp.]|uniref:hypothetical protein n=1 Tax=Cetobacterium sp. TaxID=2071632 RepID=UPI003F3E8F67